MTLVAPRIVNSVSCVTRINDEIRFSWQAQYLVSLGNDTCYSAHCVFATFVSLCGPQDKLRQAMQLCATWAVFVFSQQLGVL